MKKKVLAIVLCVAMLAIAIVGGTMAYFTDTDAKTNTMTIGSVSIEQIEQERGEGGTLITFTPGKAAMPAVGEIKWADDMIQVGDYQQKVFHDDMKNVMDKIVTVKNTGKSDAFVRTIVAIEAPEYDKNNILGENYNVEGMVDQDWNTWQPVDIDGIQYVYMVFTYEKALAPEEVSAPSLVQLYLASKTTNEDVAAFGDTWDVLVLSQAVQEAGFPDATTALNEAFGETNATNVADWLAKK